jgi:hypothetical protein
MVLSLTLADGNNVKYLIKLPEADKLQAATKEGASLEKVSSWELGKTGHGIKHRASSFTAWRRFEDFTLANGCLSQIGHTSIRGAGDGTSNNPGIERPVVA